MLPIQKKKFRINNLYEIVDKHGSSINFRRNQAQEKLAKKIREIKKKDWVVRLLILKARQIWSTTHFLIENLDRTITNKHQTIVLVAHQREKMVEIFQKVKYAYDNIPNVKMKDGTRSKPKATLDNRNELFFRWINSKFRVSLNTRSWTLTALHISELAFRRDAREMMTGTLPSVPDHVDIVIESTANGMGNYYHEIRNKNYNNPKWTWHCLFIPRYFTDEYRTEIDDKDFVLPEQLKHLDKLPISEEQKYWYYRKRLDLDEDVFQEYPSTPEEAFLVSGKTVYNPRQIKALRDVDYVEDAKYPELRIYKTTKEICYIGGDTAEWWDDWDYSSLSVREADWSLVMWYYAKMPPDKLGEVIDHIISFYGIIAVIGIERNNTGLTTIVKCKEYWWSDMLYVEETVDRTTNKTKKQIWRQTNGKTRPLMVDEHEEAVRKWRITEIDERHKTEMYSFIYNEKTYKPEAAEWAHDDFVIADCICWQMRKHKPLDLSVLQTKI